MPNRDPQSRHVADVLTEYGVRLTMLEHVVAALAAGTQSRLAILASLERMRAELIAEFPDLAERNGIWTLIQRLTEAEPDDDGNPADEGAPAS